MKLLLPAMLLVSLAVPSPASSEGALAIGIPESGLREGFAFGWRIAAPSAASAETGAIEECRRQAQNFGVPVERCKIVASFRGQCVSVALDGNERWAGWAVGKTREEAIASALKSCGEGARNCKTFDADCDR